MMYYQSCDAITMVTVGTDKTLQKVSAVVNTAETYVFMLRFSGDQAKNYQLRVLGKFREQLFKASRHPMGCMHLVTCQAHTQKSGYTSYNSVYVSTLCCGRNFKLSYTSVNT
jgi:hypothetical protein